MPYQIDGCAGKSYRPSNGMEGMRFAEILCAHCNRSEDGEPCQIFDFAFWNDIGDADYPKEWVHDERGRPTCTAFSQSAVSAHPQADGGNDAS